jgi:acyl-CoA thioesterase
MNEATKLVGDERRRADDRAFFGLRLDASMRRGRFTAIDALSNPRGTLYGGAGVAAAIAMMEAATERRAHWTTLQFLSFASRGDEVECAVDVRSHGKYSSQVRVSAHVNGEEIFTALGATGAPRADLTTTFERMPSVPGPDDSPVVEAMVPGDLTRSRFSVTEHRLAGEADDLRETGSQVAFWVRVDGLPPSPAMLGYVGDCVALGMYRALGLEIGGGTSLDNTLRLGPHVETEWVLLDVRSHVIADGYGHGTVYLWAPNGALLGMASQTLVLRLST